MHYQCSSCGQQVSAGQTRPHQPVGCCRNCGGLVLAISADGGELRLAARTPVERKVPAVAQAESDKTPFLVNLFFALLPFAILIGLFAVIRETSGNRGPTREEMKRELLQKQMRQSQDEGFEAMQKESRRLQELNLQEEERKTQKARFDLGFPR